MARWKCNFRGWNSLFVDVTVRKRRGAAAHSQKKLPKQFSWVTSWSINPNLKPHLLTWKNNQKTLKWERLKWQRLSLNLSLKNCCILTALEDGHLSVSSWVVMPLTVGHVGTRISPFLFYTSTPPFWTVKTALSQVYWVWFRCFWELAVSRSLFSLCSLDGSSPSLSSNPETINV